MRVDRDQPASSIRPSILFLLIFHLTTQNFPISHLGHLVVIPPTPRHTTWLEFRNI